MNPFDVTALVVEQASFEDNAYTSWVVSPAPTSVGSNMVEYSNTTFDMYQVLYGMPAGVYQLQTQAFYRYGGATAHYSAYNNGNIKRNVKLYIIHGTAGTNTADVIAKSVAGHTFAQFHNLAHTFMPEDQGIGCRSKSTFDDVLIRCRTGSGPF